MAKKIKKKAKKKSAPKKAKKKPAVKKKSKKKKAPKSQKKSGPSIPKAKIAGVVTHYFPHVKAAVIKIKKPVSVGEEVLIKGATSDFKQKIQSMQIDHVPIQKAKKGDEIGLQVRERVREGDLVLFP